jgi:predicted enzyme involved in methoxymalonyl-ACP biosynthesis
VTSAWRKIALALNVSADQLLFEDDERGPSDDLRLQFEAVSRLDPDERNVLKSLIEGMLLKHEAKRWAA